MRFRTPFRFSMVSENRQLGRGILKLRRKAEPLNAAPARIGVKGGPSPNMSAVDVVKTPRT